MRYVVNGGAIWDNDGSLIRNGTIIVEEDKITKVDDTASIKSKPSDETIDCKDKLIIPGMVNAHTHLYSTLSRGLMLPGYSPDNFLEILRGLWWKLDRNLTEETIGISALVGGIEFLQNGVTTIFDHHSSPRSTSGSLEIIAGELIDKLGLRSSLCYEVTDRNGKDETELGIRENLNWLSTVSNRKDDMAAGQFGLHASFTLSTKTLKEIGSYLSDINAGIHVHTAEGQEDQQDALTNYGTRVVNRLNNYNLLNDKSIVVHGIHLAESEKDLLADLNTTLVHNPRSNMNNAVGVADVPGMLRRGIPVALGNDGMGFDMIQEFQTASLLQKIYLSDPNALAIDKIGEMLFNNNYQLANKSFGAKIGKIKPDYKADFVVMDYQPPTPLKPENIYNHFLYGFSGNNHKVETVFIDGKPVMRDSVIIGIDEDDIYRNARELTSSLWNKIQNV